MDPSDGPVDLLREHGVRVTAQRLAVLRAIGDRPHGTAQDVAELARAAIGAISHQAVYDALAVLVEKGILRRIQPAGSAARYELGVGDDHHHLVCRACGRIVDVESTVGVAPSPPLDEVGDFEIDEAEVIYWGLCPECRRADGTT
jgi:Fur family ferric uptake transcriptional regulator